MAPGKDPPKTAIKAKSSPTRARPTAGATKKLGSLSSVRTNVYYRGKGRSDEMLNCIQFQASLSFASAPLPSRVSAPARIPRNAEEDRRAMPPPPPPGVRGKTRSKNFTQSSASTSTGVYGGVSTSFPDKEKRKAPAFGEVVEILDSDEEDERHKFNGGKDGERTVG